MIKNLFLLILIAYLGLAVYAKIFDYNMIFPIFSIGYKDVQNIIKLNTIDNKSIGAKYLPNINAKYTILYSHGNAEDLGAIEPFLENLQRQGFAVFAYDYHGYGISEGKPSEQNTYNDIDAAYDYLVNNLDIKPERIIVFGFSIGAAPSIDLAIRKKVAALILQGPFLSAYRVVTQIPLLPFDRFNNLAKIDKVHVPVLFIHGTKDHTVPFWHGRKLYDTANSPKYFYWVEGAGHNNLYNIAGQKYWNIIEDFVAKI